MEAKTPTDFSSRKIESFSGDLTEEQEKIIAMKDDSFDNSEMTKWFEDVIILGDSIVEGGSAREIVKLLNAYKADAKNGAEQDPAPAPQDQPDEASLDAAEGVRSSGMRLPEQPAPAGDFQAAWDEFK